MEEFVRWIRNKVNNVVARAVLTAIRQEDGKHGTKLYAQIKDLRDNNSDIELLQQYGFRSMPLPGSRGVLIAYGGNKDNVTLINVDDKRVKIPLVKGDVVVYNADLSYTKYSGKKIEHVSETSQKFIVGNSELLLEPDGIKLTIDGTEYEFTTSSLSAGADIETSSGDVTAGTVSLKNHLTSAVETGTDISGPPVP